MGNITSHLNEKISVTGIIALRLKKLSKLIGFQLQVARYSSLVFIVIVAGATDLSSQEVSGLPIGSIAIEDYEFVIDNSTLAMGAADFQEKFTNTVMVAKDAGNQDVRIKDSRRLPRVNVTHATDIVGSGASGTDALAFNEWLENHNCDTTNLWIFQTQIGTWAAYTPNIGPGTNGFIFTVSSQDYDTPLMIAHETEAHGKGALLINHINARVGMNWQYYWDGWIDNSDGKTLGAASTGGHYISTYTIPDAFNINSITHGGDGYFHFDYYGYPARVAVDQIHNNTGMTDVSTGIHNFNESHPDRTRHEDVDKPPIPQPVVNGNSVSISNSGDYNVVYPSTTDSDFPNLNATPEEYSMYLYYNSDTTNGNFDQGPIPINGSFNNVPEGTHNICVYKYYGNSRSFVSQSINIDVTAPSSTMSGPEATNVSPVVITQEFSEPIDQSTLTASDYTVNHGTPLSLVFVNDSTVEITVEPNTGFVGDVDITLPANSCTDLNGVGNSPSSSFSFYFDAEQPDPDQSSSTPNVTNANSFSANLDFPNEPVGVTGVTADDFWTENCTVSNVQGNWSNYTYTITPNGEGEVKTKYLENQAEDPATNLNTESEEFSRTIDWTNPDVNVHDNNPEIIGGGTYTAFIDFTEPVNGFTSNDITAVNAAKSNFQIINSSSYSVDYTPENSGPLSLSINNNKCEDEATNSNNASNTLEKTANLDSPSSNMSSTAPFNTNADTIDVEIPFNKPVYGLDFNDFLFTNAEGADFTQVNDSTWAVKAIPQEDGTYSIELPAGSCVDEFNNPALADFFERLNDKTRPDPIITGEINEDGTVSLTIDFGEDVTGFTSTDVTLTNGAVMTDFQGEGAIYTGLITPTGTSCQILIDEAVCNDLALNPNLESDPYQIVIDGVLTHYNELENFKIYPNPANDFVNIKTEGNIRSVEVYDASGKLVILDIDKYEDGAQVDISGLQNGIYIIHFMNENGYSAKAIVVKD